MKIHVVTAIAWFLLQSLSWKTSEAVTKFTLDLMNPSHNHYSSFLSTIRNEVRDRTLKYGGTDIDVLKKPPKNGYDNNKKFLRLNLRRSQGTVVSLAMRSEDLYVAAYFATDDQNVHHAYYFKGLINSAQLTIVFPEVAVGNQRQLRYGEDYQAIEREADIPLDPKTGDQSRKQLGLGMELLKVYIDEVNMRLRVVRNEARFLLIAIQMVAEATRFKYIQKLVVDNYLKEKFNSNDQVIGLQKNWEKISKAIFQDCKSGVFNRTQEFGFGPVKKVTDLGMGLLKYIGEPKLLIETNYTYGTAAVL